MPTIDAARTAVRHDFDLPDLPAKEHRMRATRMTALTTLTTLAVSAAPMAHAGESVVWNFSAETSGEDTYWTSDDAVDPGAASYDTMWQIDSVIANVTWTIITIDIDVTDELPPEALSGSGSFDGPAPVTVFSSDVQIPDPPADPDLAATITLGINAAGIGTFSATDVVLGSTQVDLGPPFGMQTVQINSIAVAGTITVTAIAPDVPGDATGDGIVNFDDLLAVLSAWGACPGGGAPCPADLDGDGTVGFNDVIDVLSNWS